MELSSLYPAGSRGLGHKAQRNPSRKTFETRTTFAFHVEYLLFIRERDVFLGRTGTEEKSGFEIIAFNL